jgi:Ca-activated chloride channel homolog
MDAFHFLRPYWLLMLIPLVFLIFKLLKLKPALQAWGTVCDKHLIEHLIHSKQGGRRLKSLSLLFISLCFIIMALSGPTWSRYPVPTFKQTLPRILVLDVSNSMLTNDMPPSRFRRAKYKLHDLLKLKGKGQFGMIVYTSEPFVVSPLTDDAKTIDALLSSLSPDIMPVQGQRLDLALEQAGELIKQAGYKNGDILVLTSTPPTSKALDEAKSLAQAGIHTSIMPVMKNSPGHPHFKRLAALGGGRLIPFKDTSTDLDQWLNDTSERQQITEDLKQDVPVWKDQGRWFLIPALVLLLPVFRRGWLQRLTT